MHFCDGLAAPCMGGGAWVGARCWLAGRGAWSICVGFSEPVTSLSGGCYLKWIFGYVCFWVPEPVTSLMGGCYMKWILIFLYFLGRGNLAMTTYNRQTDRQTDRPMPPPFCGVYGTFITLSPIFPQDRTGLFYSLKKVLFML